MNNGKQNVIKDKTFNFAIRIVKIYQYLCKEKNEYVLSKQILKSGTSIGANVEEADASISRKEFSSKISIAYKETKETLYWLKLLKETEYLEEKIFTSIFEDCTQISKILFSILKTTRINK